MQNGMFKASEFDFVMVRDLVTLIFILEVCFLWDFE